MPNWAEGTLKIRGTQENVINCLKEYVTGNVYPIFEKNEEGNVILKQGQHEVSIKRDEWEFSMSCKGGFYIKNTRRAFIESTEIQFYLENEIEKIEITGFKQAWSVEPGDFLEMSKKHQLDIKIFAFEKGMEFTQEIEIIKGEITKYLGKEYEDYFWSVPFASIGG